MTDDIFEFFKYYVILYITYSIIKRVRRFYEENCNCK